MSYEMLLIFLLAFWVGINECRLTNLEKKDK